MKRINGCVTDNDCAKKYNTAPVIIPASITFFTKGNRPASERSGMALHTLRNSKEAAMMLDKDAPKAIPAMPI